MNVCALTGFREYLEPKRAHAAALTAALRAVEPRAFIPQPRWTATASPYHDLEAERDVELFLEYVEDISARDDVVVLVLPSEAVLTAARRRFGQTAVRTRRLLLSDTTEAVLRRLAPDGGHEPAAGDWQVSCPEMLANYTHAVLRLLEPMVKRDGLFASSAGPERLADLLAAGGFHLRPDVGPDRILAEIRPGGELHALFSRPFLLASAEEASTLARAV